MSISDNEFILKLLRVSRLRSRLLTNTIDAVGISLRNGLIDCNTAIEWLVEEGVDIVPLTDADREAA